ncbi:DNA topoisomerase 3 [Christensenellaceae bacterium OttesenSCG-928-K19]|nr:DNA topoisomerase 3 [Christensenellaceae bacterium OttesenSCG-928-K19]
MKLVIAEKPSVSKSLAGVLGANERGDGCFIGGSYIVSWCFGHLVELARPAAYGEQYKRWAYDTLPILPDAWKYTPSDSGKKQLEILRALMKRDDVESIVNACDAGREGELIFRLVYEYCGCQKPTERLWISSMEDAAIRDGFAKLRDGADYANLFGAALCRAQADWVTGINATRLFSILYESTLNVGRVQSPTLAMIVSREAAVQSFTPEPFYIPIIDTGTFTVSGEKLRTPEEAESIRAACDGGDATVLSVEKKRKIEAPPKLYDLTSLQRHANRLLGYTAQQTLDYAQSLYEKKLMTYPRTDSNYITGDMAAGLAELVNLAAMRLPFAKVPVSVDPSLVVDDGKVTDHHALLPTNTVRGLDWDTLPTGERNILTMLIVRLACAVGEAHTFETAEAVLECGGFQFTTKGKTVLHEGWKGFEALYRAALKKKSAGSDADDEQDEGALPELSEGQVFSPVAASVREGKTAPPKRYTEDLLLAAMETAGAEEMPDDAERKGLGTPATRAGIIEKLVKTGFVERKKKLLIPSQKGANLIAVLPEEIKSPLLTAQWEQKLKQVERGELAGGTFMDGIATLVKGFVTAHTAPLPEFASLFAERPKGAVVGKCPRCGADVIESGKGFFCSSRACKFALWKDSRFWQAKEKKLDKKIAAALLSEGRVFFSDLKSARTGKQYAAAIVLEDDGGKVNYKLDFEQKSNGRKSA